MKIWQSNFLSTTHSIHSVKQKKQGSSYYKSALEIDGIPKMNGFLLGWLSRDGKLILTARIVRTFAYGYLSIILAIYLKLIGVNDVLIGLVLTATLVNSAIFTLVASFYADRTGRRKF